MANLFDLLGPRLLDKSGEVDTAVALSGKTVGLYFSAHWCPPCRGFTPLLAKSYTAHLKAKGLEVIFVSADRDLNTFESYFADMPWLSLPFSSERKDVLSQKYAIQSYPTLLILDSDGSVKTRKGRQMVSADPKGDQFPWTDSTIEDQKSNAPAQKKGVATSKNTIQKSRLLYAIPGVVEVLCAAGKIATVCASASLLIQWLLLDGILGIAEVMLGLFQAMKVLDAQSDPELKAYLISKKITNTVDPVLEERAKLLKADPLNPTNNPLNPILRWSNLAMLIVGGYLAFISKFENECDEGPLRLVKPLIIFKVVFPGLVCCVEQVTTSGVKTKNF